MHKISLILLVSGLLLGASRCSDDPEDANGVGEGSGSAGSEGGQDDHGNTRGEPCGSTTCEAGQVCCNESCGICTGPDGACTQQFCEPGTLSGEGGGPACGGIAGRGCPGAGQCIDDPGDDCDPENGGADCGGVCACRALARCTAGTLWNASPEVCSCEPDEGGGSQPGDPGDAEVCGNVTCPAGQECCNESCGICTEPGGFCTEQFCGDPDPAGVPCGPNICAAGEECCNESCGVCVEPGGACDQQFCGDPDPDPEYGPFCGGFGGFACPGEGACVDDPRDDCDPEHGGADCGGVCECTATSSCPDGSSWNGDPTVCACASDDPGAGESCGNMECPSGQVCCNASCGICTDPGGACIQIACL